MAEAGDAANARRRTTSFADEQNKAAAEGHDESTPTGVTVTQTSDGTKITTVVANEPGRDATRRELSYVDAKVIGNGSFGLVFQAKLLATGEPVAIKKVLQDPRFKNRELQIMRNLSHRNVVDLKYFFYSTGSKKDEIYLNLILEFVPETLYQLERAHTKASKAISILHVKLFIYQTYRALAYIHKVGVCHRDIKPQNLLVNPFTGVVKLCDFGSAKMLVPGEKNVAYICSRYYRAPELIFGATEYTTSIDVWSVGCVMAELLLGQPLFPGESSVDQLVEIIKILGTPTREQIFTMNPNYNEFKFPLIRAHPWTKVFRPRVPPEAIALITAVLDYTPTNRPTAFRLLAHEFFDELRAPGANYDGLSVLTHDTTSALKSPSFSGQPLPTLFDFSADELSIEPSLNERILPHTAIETMRRTFEAEL